MRQPCLEKQLIFLLFLSSTAYADPVKVPSSAGTGRKYEIILKTAGIQYSNPDYIGPDAFVRITQKGRGSTRILNAFFPILQDLSDINATYVGLQRLDNKWKESIVHINWDFCLTLPDKLHLHHVMLDSTNFPQHCPIPKGNYTVSNWTFDHPSLPKVVIPGSREWRIQATWGADTSGAITMIIYWFEFKIRPSKSDKVILAGSIKWRAGANWGAYASGAVTCLISSLIEASTDCVPDGRGVNVGSCLDTVSGRNAITYQPGCDIIRNGHVAKLFTAFALLCPRCAQLLSWICYYSQMWSLYLTAAVVQYVQGASLLPLQRVRPSNAYVTAAQMEKTSPEFVGPGSYLRVSRPNEDSSPVMNGYIPIIQDLPPEVNSSWICYNKFKNQWRESLVKGSLSLCDILDSKIKLYRLVFNYSNFPSTCPVNKGNYSITNFKFERDNIPPIVPSTEWRTTTWWTIGDEVILSYSFEYKIDLSSDPPHTKKKHEQRH